MKQKEEKKSALLLLHPIVKGVLCIGLILIFSFFCKNWLMALNLNLFLILFCFYAKEGAISLIASIRKIWLLLLIVGFFQGFVGTEFNLFACLGAIFRVMGVYLTATLYTRVSTQNELLYSWEIFFKPIGIFGFSSSELALTMVIAIRFLPVLLGEIERIKMAQIARGAKLKSNSIVEAINFMPLLVPVLTQAIMRSEELADAMEVRGYAPNRPRGRYKVYRFSAYDFLALLMLALLFFITVSI